jgi:hypothetical protein
MLGIACSGYPVPVKYIFSKWRGEITILEIGSGIQRRFRSNLWVIHGLPEPCLIRSPAGKASVGFCKGASCWRRQCGREWGP